MYLRLFIRRMIVVIGSHKSQVILIIAVVVVLLLRVKFVREYISRYFEEAVVWTYSW